MSPSRVAVPCRGEIGVLLITKFILSIVTAALCKAANEPFKYAMMSAFVLTESGPVSSPASAGGCSPRAPAARI